MANSYNTTDILKGTLQRCGERADVSPYRLLALKYINNVYMSVLAGSNEFDMDLGRPWPWAKSPNNKILTLQPALVAGTITVTNGSTAATLSSAPAVGLGSLAGRMLKIDSRPEFFKVLTHTAGDTSLVLDGIYTDTTGSGLSYKLIKITYTLDQDVLRLTAPFVIYKDQFFLENEGQVWGINQEEFNKIYTLTNMSEEIPTRFYESFDASMNLQATFNSYPTQQTRVEIPYIPFPVELTEDPASIPLIPREFRVVLEYGAAYYLMLDKEDSRAPTYMQLTQAKLKAMIIARDRQNTHTARQKGQLIPRQEQINRNLIGDVKW